MTDPHFHSPDNSRKFPGKSFRDCPGNWRGQTTADVSRHPNDLRSRGKLTQSANETPGDSAAISQNSFLCQAGYRNNKNVIMKGEKISHQSNRQGDTIRAKKATGGKNKEGHPPPPCGSPLIGSSGESVARILMLGLKGNQVAAASPARDEDVGSATHAFKATDLIPAMDQSLTWVLGKEVSCVEILLDEETSLKELHLVKGVAKRLCAGASSRPWRGLTRAIYFSAIAAAYVHYDELITSKTQEDLVKIFRNLKRSPCLPPGLKPIISNAYKALSG